MPLIMWQDIKGARRSSLRSSMPLTFAAASLTPGLPPPPHLHRPIRWAGVRQDQEDPSPIRLKDHLWCAQVNTKHVPAAASGSRWWSVRTKQAQRLKVTVLIDVMKIYIYMLKVFILFNVIVVFTEFNNREFMRVINLLLFMKNRMKI